LMNWSRVQAEHCWLLAWRAPLRKHRQLCTHLTNKLFEQVIWMIHVLVTRSKFVYQFVLAWILLTMSGWGRFHLLGVIVEMLSESKKSSRPMRRFYFKNRNRVLSKYILP
jgi:hypothetical protein